jgi:hypothetical protein
MKNTPDKNARDLLQAKGMINLLQINRDHLSMMLDRVSGFGNHDTHKALVDILNGLLKLDEAIDCEIFGVAK